MKIKAHFKFSSVCPVAVSLAKLLRDVSLQGTCKLQEEMGV
jgi:hypothetical protein